MGVLGGVPAWDWGGCELRLVMLGRDEVTSDGSVWACGILIPVIQAPAGHVLAGRAELRLPLDGPLLHTCIDREPCAHVVYFPGVGPGGSPGDSRGMGYVKMVRRGNGVWVLCFFYMYSWWNGEERGCLGRRKKNSSSFYKH